MDNEQVVRIADALANIENQLFGLNEWLVRYGETRLAPPLPSPGIHLVRIRSQWSEEVLAHGRALAEEMRAALRADAVNLLMRCEPMFREVRCDVFPVVGSGWIIEVDQEDEGVGYMRRTWDGKARQLVGATVSRVNLSSMRGGWIWLRRFYDGEVFDCKLIVLEEKEPAEGPAGEEGEGAG